MSSIPIRHLAASLVLHGTSGSPSFPTNNLAGVLLGFKKKRDSPWTIALSWRIRDDLAPQYSQQGVPLYEVLICHEVVVSRSPISILEA